jgi:hypothetical protein
MKRMQMPACAVSLVLLASAPGLSQDPAAVEAALSAARKQQRFHLSGTLAVSAAEGQKFWPACDRYEASIAKLDARNARVITDLLRGQAATQPATANALIEESLRLEAERLDLLQAHVEELRKVLSPPTLVRYVQLRNRLDLKIRWDIAQQIPLAGQ